MTLLLGWGSSPHRCSPGGSSSSAGVYLASNPHSSFFYVLTGLHAIHLLGGILALAALYFYGSRGSGAEAEAKRRALTDVTGIYWHFMDALWVFLFLLLFFRR